LGWDFGKREIGAERIIAAGIRLGEVLEDDAAGPDR
jgi:hypothetical protein